VPRLEAGACWLPFRKHYRLYPLRFRHKGRGQQYHLSRDGSRLWTWWRFPRRGPGAVFGSAQARWDKRGRAFHNRPDVALQEFINELKKFINELKK